MKKIVFALSFMPFAVVAGQVQDYFSGFYVGGGVGGVEYHSKQSLNFDPTKVMNTQRYNTSQRENESRFLGSLNLGYGYQFKLPLYLAAEAIAEFFEPSTSWEGSDFNFRRRQDNAFGGRLKLGYVHQHWLLYGLAGLEHGQVKRSVSFVPGGIYNRNMMRLQTLTANSTLIKQLGAGMNWALTTHWALQFEYAHNFYQNKESPIDHQLITYNNPKGKANFSLNGNEFLLGARYRFG